MRPVGLKLAKKIKWPYLDQFEYLTKSKVTSFSSKKYPCF